MFTPFLANSGLLAAFTQFGAISVKFSFLALNLKATAIAFLIATMAAIALSFAWKAHVTNVGPYSLA